MSQLEAASEGVSYVHCTFCNTVLAVSVPCSSLMMAAAAGYNNVVTVRCGHCSNLLSVNLGALHQTAANVAPLPLNHPHNHHQLDHHLQEEQIMKNVSGSSSSSSSINRCINFTSAFESADAQNAPPTRVSPIPPPEKRQRIPSAYNRFIKEEIQRIKASSPEITHREAFSMAAKNWAHFPRIHFGLKVESNKRPKPDGAFMAGEATSPKSHEFY